VIIGATLAAELFNTALEYLCDLLHPNFHPQIAMAKDCAAAAVLVLSLTSLLVFVAFVYERAELIYR
jgi:diacylglycerol kinase (ATP)